MCCHSISRRRGWKRIQDSTQDYSTFCLTTKRWDLRLGDYELLSSSEAAVVALQRGAQHVILTRYMSISFRVEAILASGALPHPPFKDTLLAKEIAKIALCRSYCLVKSILCHSLLSFLFPQVCLRMTSAADRYAFGYFSYFK